MKNHFKIPNFGRYNFFPDGKCKKEANGEELTPSIHGAEKAYTLTNDLGKSEAFFVSAVLAFHKRMEKKSKEESKGKIQKGGSALHPTTLGPEDAVEIRRLFHEEGKSPKEIGTLYSRTDDAIRKIIRGINLGENKPEPLKKKPL